jgi:hypothetical protein
MKVMAVKQLQSASPQLYNPIAVDSAVLQAMGWNNPDQFFKPAAERGQMPPEAQAMVGDLMIRKQEADTKQQLAQAKIAETQAKMGQAGGGGPGGLPLDKVAELALKKQELDLKAKEIDARMLNDQAKVANDQAKMNMEMARAAREQNPGSDPAQMMDLRLREIELMQKAQDNVLDAVNRKRDRESRERLAAVRLAENMAKNPQGIQIVDNVLDPGMVERLESNEPPLPGGPKTEG